MGFAGPSGRTFCAFRSFNSSLHVLGAVERPLGAGRRGLEGILSLTRRPHREGVENFLSTPDRGPGVASAKNFSP